MSIYLQHFALAREPFSIVPDPGFLYPSIYHRQAVAHLKYGLDREGGFILLTGEVGTGKTTLTRTMIKRIPPHVRVAYILNSKLNASDVLASICDELDIVLPDNSELSFTKQCIDALNSDLLAAHAEGKKTLIVIEEAQNLTPEVLETLRLLSNLETSTHKLLHILLVGQPELLDILAKQELRQLNQRVVSRFHLSPLDKNDLSNYINHRLHRAGAKRPIFDDACVAVLFRLTGGVPRLINLVCHQSLVAAYSIGAPTVSAKLVKQAASEILSQPKKSSLSKSLLIAAIAISLLIAALAVIYVSNPSAFQLPATTHKEIADKTTPDKTIPDKETPDQEQLIVEPKPEALLAMSEASLSRAISVDIPLPEENIPELDVPAPEVITNPFVGLLALWGVESVEAYSEEELAVVASLQNLRAEKVRLPELASLEQINRPGVVWLRVETGYLKSYVLAQLSFNAVTLQDRQGEVQMTLKAFQAAWNGSYLYLWKPPQGYIGPLSVTANNIESNTIGENPPLVLDWLQAQLRSLDNNSEIIISGGRYTSAIAQQVLGFQRQQGLVADGILGRETLMRLTQLSADNIPLLMEAM